MVSFIDIQSLAVPKKFIKSVVKSIEYNELITGFYDRYAAESGEFDVQQKVFKKVKRISDCNSFWLIDRYDQQQIKDFKKTNLCLDKFCNNCKKVKQANRRDNFEPEIERVKAECNLYHLVLTVPNVDGVQLRETIKILFKSFYRLIRYLKGDAKIKGLSFASWGYRGALRSLEVTYKGDSYHPHLHIALAMDKTLGSRLVENVYSYDNYGRRKKRLFTPEEVLLQKIWYLSVNGIKVTLAELEETQLGYSCNMDLFQPDQYNELFKYMTKFDKAGGMSYENFSVLYESLEGVRQIQGYGCFYNLEESENGITLSVDEMYDGLVKEWQKKETPVEVCEAPQRLLEDSVYVVVSRKRIFKYLQEIKD